MAARVPYSKQDSTNLVSWVARNHPENANRNGNVMWRELANDPKARPWNGRHSWQSWRDQYVKNAKHYDTLIDKYITENNLPRAVPRAVPVSSSQATQFSGMPLASQSASQRQEDAQDAKHLAQYFADKSIKEKKRMQANVFQDMRSDEEQAEWALKRSGVEWRDLYRDYKERIDKRVLEIRSREPLSSNSDAEADTTKQTRKRRREKTENTRDDGAADVTEEARGAKRRRIENQEPNSVNGAANSHPSRSGKARPSEQDDAQHETSNAQSSSVKDVREPIVFAPDTPPTSQSESGKATPQPTNAKPSGAFIEASNHLPSPISPPIQLRQSQLPSGQHSVARTQVSQSEAGTPGTVPRPGKLNVAKVISSALNTYSTVGMGQYGIEGSPVTVRRNSVSLEDEVVPASHTTASQSQSQSQPQVHIQTQTQTQKQTPPAPQPNAPTSVFGKMGISSIFPRSLPSLTPILRAKSGSQRTLENARPTQQDEPHEVDSGVLSNGGDESTRVTSAEEAEVEQDLVNGDGDRSTTLHNSIQEALLTPKNAAQGRRRHVIERVDRDGNEHAIADDDEDDPEGPSPMPNMGSDHHSNRSFSFSHDVDDDFGPRHTVQDAARPQGGEVFLEPLEPEATEGQIIIEESDAPPRREPRYFLPRRRPRRLSESPLFASSSDTEASPRSNRKDGAVEPEAIHHPLTMRNTAFGTLRDRSPRRSLGSQAGSAEKVNSREKRRVTIGVEDADEGESQDDAFQVFQDDDEDKENQAGRVSSENVQQNGLLDTPDDPLVPLLDLRKPPQPSAKFVNSAPADGMSALRTRRSSHVVAPFTARPASKVANDPFLDSGSRPRPWQNGRFGVHYTAPNISRFAEAKYENAEEPSPSLQRAERLKRDERRRYSIGDENVALGEEIEDSKKRHVRFDGVTIDRDRRKTTGGIGVQFGNTIPSSSSQVADLFKDQDPKIKADRAQMGIPSKDRSPNEIINLESDEDDEDESPLARYSTREAPSTEATSSAAKVHSMLNSRRSSIRSRAGPLPPAGVPVPIVPISSPMSVNSSPITNTMASKASRGRASMQDMTAAEWSPLQFDGDSNNAMDVDQPMQEDEVPSIDFRDQRRDADWVDITRGRLSVSSRRLNPSKRNAPFPSADDVVVYSSSPSREPSRDRPKLKPRKRTESTAQLNAAPISQEDQEVIIKFLIEQSFIEDGEEVDLETLRDGMTEMFQSMADSTGFGPKIPRNVWMQCGNIEKTGVILQKMADSANNTGLKALKLQHKKDMATRDEWLRESVDGRRASSFSNRTRDASLRREEEEASQEDEDEIVERTRLRARRSMDQRFSKPPTHVPAEVLEPLLNQ